MTTKRILTLAAAGTLAAVSTVAFSLTTWLSASAAPSEVRLHLGTDAQKFTYGTTVQVIEVGKNTCAIKNPSPQTLISLSSTNGGSSAPGLSNYGLGIKASPSSGNGSPCAQIDSTESLTITPGTSLGTRSFTSARLDLEMTGNAVVVVTVAGSGQSKQYAMQTGTSITVPITDGAAPYLVASGPGTTNATVACAAPNSSGSNNQGNDNCQWTISPGFSFTSLTITTTTLGATASLEGGGDFGNDPAFETLFTLTNTAPTAGNDSFSTNEDTAGTFSGLLSNDSDSDGDALAVTSNTQAAHGSVTSVTAAGAFTYTPVANYNGADSFTYTISDGNSTATATVNITVVPVNDPPVAVNSTPTTPEETAVTVTVGTDIDSTQLTSTCNSVPPVGTIVDNGNGTITYTPPTNFVGAVTITCTVRDSQGATSQSSATVNVTVTNVNDPPVAVNDTASVNQNRTTPFVTNFSVPISVLTNDTDIDASETLTPASVSDPPNGTAIVQGTTIVYTPDANFIGTDTFTYRADDGEALSNVATVTVTVIRVMCSGEEVTDFDTGVAATFVLLTSATCKPYALDAVPQVGATSRYVLFQPVGASQVDYRGIITFGPEPVDISAGGELVLKLEYDPNGGNTFQPVQLCINPQFDSLGKVISATRPGVEKWCIASETTVAAGAGQAKTTWQVFGHDDPKYQ